MRVCITAANCFIGLPLVKKASSLGWDVVAVVREGNKQKDYIGSLPNTKVFELNLEDYGRIGDIAGKVDCAVLLAWNGTRGLARFDDKLQESNYIYNLEAVKSLITHGCERIVTAGSQAEYGLCNEVIIETRKCKPNTAYGYYKVKLFEEAADYCQRHGVSIKEPRFFSLYGPGDYENTLIMGNIKKMLADAVCDMTPCTQMWDYLYIDDAVDGIIGLCSKNCPDGAYNFGSGDCTRLKDFVYEMRDVLNSSSDLNFGAVPYTPAGVVSIRPDITRLKNTGWEPKISFSQGIAKILELSGE